MFSAVPSWLGWGRFVRKASLSFSLLTFLLPQQAVFSQNPSNSQDFTLLKSESIVDKEISNGQKHVYRIDLAAGQYASISIFQRRIDISLTILDADGNLFAEPEVSKAENHEKLISILAERSGKFSFNFTTKTQNTQTGSYRIKTGKIKAPTERERELAEAFRLSSEGRKLGQTAKYDEALAKQRQALEILVKAADPEDVRIADVNNEIGLIYDGKSDLKNAKEYYLKALGVYERVLGPENYYVAAVLNNLGPVYRAAGDFDKASESYQRALAINEKLFGPEDLSVASILNNLAFLYYAKGEYARAEEPYLRALAIRKKQLGSDNMDVATLMNNLALLFRVRGDYASSIAYFDQALATAENALGPDHPSIAIMVSNIASVSMEVGDFSKGQELFDRALGINEKRLGPLHPNVAINLNNLALLYDEAGEYEKAEPLFRRALMIREKAFEAGHAIIGVTLGNLGLLYLHKQDYDKAEPLFVRALEISEKKLGGEHSTVAHMLNNLGLLHLRKGEYAEAEPLLLRSLAIFQKANGPNHPFGARVLGNLADLYWSRGDLAKAAEFQRKYLAVRERNLDLNLFTGSERQKLAYMETLTRDVDSAVSMQASLSPLSRELKEISFTLILSRKGRTLDAMAGSISALRTRARPADQELIDRLADARTRLAALTLRGAANDRPEAYSKKLQEVGEQREKLEDDLSRRSAEFRVQTQPLTIDAVQGLIPENGALIEFVVYKPVKAGAPDENPSSGAARYAAYVTRRSGSIESVDLGDAKVIDASISALRLALGDPRNKNVAKPARDLDEKVMKPVRAYLGNATHLMISPDGALNLVPFEALVDDRNKYLVEQFSVSYLTSGRDLLRMGVARASKGPPLVVADPAFGQPETQTIGKTVTQSKIRPTTKRRSSITSTRSIADTYFAPLAGTALEARSIQEIFPDASSVTGARATESSLKAVSGPKLLHIATHGFFLKGSDPVSGNLPTRSGTFSKARENPLLRSGLALAGANRRGSGPDDGILTALEASGLDLWGTKLVVLSACDTGVGEVRNGEGVYGLRRAFVLAGTESLVMSLWPVSDSFTRELMAGYYKNLKQGIGRGESLRRIQLEMLKRPNRRHPFYWASFIQSGEWANLDGKR